MSRRVFQLRLDPLTGNSEWIVIDDHEDEDPQPNPKSLLATTSYLDMLNDSRRNSAFNRAIKNTVTGPCHVLDIGAGTGLLSMMAARAMAESGGGDDGTVTACESYLPMGKLMRKVLRANGMERKVKVIHKRSDEMQLGMDMDSRADVLVSEILDSELLGEGLIPTLQHAHDVLLVENPRTVPYRATVYAQLVESTYLWKLHDLYSFDSEATDGLHLTPFSMERIVGVKSMQYAMQCSAISSEIKLVSEPFRVFEFDFSRRPDSHGKTDLQIMAREDGNIHAVISWWVLELDSFGSVFYSTAPEWIRDASSEEERASTSGNMGWCDHWKQCVWFVPGRGILASKGSFISLRAVHDDISVSYHLSNVIQDIKSHYNHCHIEKSQSQLMLSPEKIGHYGDHSWRSTVLAAIRNAVKGPLFCLVADDSVFLTLALLHLSCTSCVVSAFPGLQEEGRRYVETIANANHFSMDQVKVLGRRASLLTLEDLPQKKIDILIAEPFYHGNEGVLPWQNLRFWMERTLLDSFLSEGACVMPCKGILRACAMSLPDLWRSRRCLTSIEGFNHSDVNDILGACGDSPLDDGPCLPYFVWQCGEVKNLSEAFSVMEFDLSRCAHPCSSKVKVLFTNAGVCHGFALWIDWVLDERNSITISTGPDSRYWKQGIKLLRKPIAVNTTMTNTRGCSGEIQASFNPSTGDLDVKTWFFS